MSEGGDNVSMMEMYKVASGNRKISKSRKVERGWSGRMGGGRVGKTGRRSRRGEEGE